MKTNYFLVLILITIGVKCFSINIKEFTFLYNDTILKTDTIVEDSIVLIQKEYYLKKDNFLTKEEKYYLSGNIKEKIVYHKGKESTYTYNAWYDNGVLKERFNYINNQYEGKMEKWYSSGSIKYIGEYIKGKGKLTEYYESGKIKREELVKKSLISYGVAKHWCENGTLIYTIDYSNDNSQLIVKYHCNGNKMLETNLVSSIYPVGLWRLWHENGNLEEEGYYKKHGKKISFDEGYKKIGNWKYYNEQGKLIKEENYDDNGELIDLKEY